MPVDRGRLRRFNPGRIQALARACLLGLLACLAVAAAPCLAKDNFDKKRILYFNSYHNGYSWSDGILNGVRSGLDKTGIPHDLLIEYMDTKRFPEPEMSKILFDLYKAKYEGDAPDAIVLSDDFAFQFILQHQDALFPGVPVVFTGVNDFDPAMLAGRTNITGVIEVPDFMTSFYFARTLTPGVERIVVIGDDTITGAAINKQIRQATQELGKTFPIEYWDVKTLPELLSRASDLTEHDAVYMIPIYLGSGTQVYSVEEVLAMFARETQVPIYSSWQFMLNTGMVGGRLHSGEIEGEMAAGMVARILSGESPAAIQPVDTFDDPTIFDYLVLKRFGIDKAKLPADSRFINEPLSFYTINKQIFWIIVVSFLALVFILILLIASILQKRSVEMRIKDQLNFLSILMDTIPLPLSYKGADGRYLGCNLAFEKWFGVARDDLLDNPRHALALRTDAAERHLLSRPGVLSFETDMPDASGQARGVIVSKATYQDAKGQVAGVVEAIQDITLRREAERALRRSQAMLQTVLNNIPQLVYWKDKDLRYMGVNRSFLAFFGLDDQEEVVNHTADAILPTEAALTVEDVNRRVLDSGHPEHLRDWSLTLPGRDPFQLDMNIVPLYDDAGQVVGVLGTAEDVTARTSLERQLLQSQKMEAIGALAGGIAHDFNNILTSIINSTELALMDVAPGTDMAADLGRILRAARRGSRLVEQILAFSRPTREGFAPTDVAEVLREALGIFTATLPRNITVSERCDVDPAVAFADPTQLHQIIMNLCANAYQAMRETGGHLALELTEESLEGSPAERLSLAPGRYLRIAVSDDGPGISPEIMDRIFDPFFTTKPQGEGTGLGLAVVHGIVKAHKGVLRVTSQPGILTTFEIYLPKFEREMPGRHGALESGAQVRLGREHVLFVEDDEDQIKVVPRVLGLMGYTVTARSSSALALEFLSQSPGQAQIVVTDFDMPGMSGVELARALLRMAPELPVILVSGRRSALTAAAGVGNIRNVLLKPYNGEDLAQAIGLVLDGGRI